MFCRQCGNEIHDDAVFCTKCGVKTDKFEKKKEAGESNLGIPKVIVIVLLAVLAAVGILLMIEDLIKVIMYNLR